MYWEYIFDQIVLECYWQNEYCAEKEPEGEDYNYNNYYDCCYIDECV